MIGNPLLLGPEGYQISRSVRLRSSASAYFNRTPASASNRKTMTLSAWQKRGEFSSSQEPAIMWAGTNSSNYTLFRWGNGVGNSDSKFFLNLNMYTGTTNINLVTTPLFRDPSGWYHIVLSIDTTQATAANRVRLYVNGVEITSFSSASYPSQNLDLLLNSTNSHEIGRFNFGSYLDGYLTEINFIDGQALTPSSFGETDVLTGVWKPKKYAGTYGTNGFFLNFSDPSAATAAAIGKDYSGNGNNWTPNNISLTSGATYDSMLDVPTMWGDRGNFCVLNPAIRPYPSADNIADGNLKFTSSSASVGGSAWSTIPVTTGKWYAECTVTTASASSSDFIGVSSDLNLAALGTYSAALRDYGYTYKANGNKCNNSATGTTYGASYTSGDVIGVALDAGAGTIEFFKNGTSQGTAYTGMTYSGGFLFGSTAFNGGVHNWNFGQRPFSYTPPTGFKALNTQNLPDPTIKKGNQYFDISTWTGDQSARTITNSGGMQPDFLWTKSRSAAEDHRLSDAVRGGNGTVLGTLASNTTGAEAFDTDVTGFTSSGFNIRAGTNSPNVTGRTYVGWQWKEGATQGFDIVTYTGNGTAGRTISHSLGVTPAMTIVKDRSNGTNGWPVWHRAYAGTQTLYLESTTGLLTRDRVTAVSSTTFTVGSHTEVNANGNTYVAYLFSEVAGFSKFGSYTGNGSSDGPFVFTGFLPRWVMIKRTDSTSAWLVIDTTRQTYNVQGPYLMPNTSDAETTGTTVLDVVSNGFKSRSSSTLNTNGGTYIYAAFAESPFKLSLAR